MSAPVTRTQKNNPYTNASRWSEKRDHNTHYFLLQSTLFKYIFLYGNNRCKVSRDKENEKSDFWENILALQDNRHTHKHGHTYAGRQACMHIYIHTYTSIHTYTQIHTHTHMYIHTHTSIHTSRYIDRERWQEGGEGRSITKKCRWLVELLIHFFLSLVSFFWVTIVKVPSSS